MLRVCCVACAELCCAAPLSSHREQVLVHGGRHGSPTVQQGTQDSMQASAGGETVEGGAVCCVAAVTQHVLRCHLPHAVTRHMALLLSARTRVANACGWLLMHGEQSAEETWPLNYFLKVLPPFFHSPAEILEPKTASATAIYTKHPAVMVALLMLDAMNCVSP